VAGPQYRLPGEHGSALAEPNRGRQTGPGDNTTPGNASTGAPRQQTSPGENGVAGGGGVASPAPSRPVNRRARWAPAAAQPSLFDEPFDVPTRPEAAPESEPIQEPVVARQVVARDYQPGTTIRVPSGPHERTDARITQSNGTREKIVSTTLGDLPVQIPKTRTGLLPGVTGGQACSNWSLAGLSHPQLISGTPCRTWSDTPARRNAHCCGRAGSVLQCAGESDSRAQPGALTCKAPGCGGACRDYWTL